MALKKLLTDLSAHNSIPNRDTADALSTAFQAYPNHYYPSNAGGFNYPNVSSIFDTTLASNFNQKSFRIGEGNAYDRRFQQFSEEPFIRNTIAEQLIGNPGLENFGAYGDMNSGVPNSLVRGGAGPSLSRQLDDLNRITSFLLTPKGLAFTTKQTGLQLSNPRIDKPSNSKDPESGGGFLDFIEDVAQQVIGSVANQRTYNLNGNLLAQILAQGTGLHIKREGLLPSATKGYIDANGSNSLDGPNLFGNDNKNRLIYLLKDKVYTNAGADAEPEESTTAVGSLLKKASKGINKASEFLFGKSNNLGPLYSYSGGPESVYGIGRTTIRRYSTTNKGSLPRLGDSETYDTPDLTNSSNFNDFRVSLGNLSSWTDTNNIIDRIGVGNPGTGIGRLSVAIDGKPIKQDNYNKQVQTPYTNRLNYNVYSDKRVDKLNMLDIFEYEGVFDEKLGNDLIKFRFEAVDTFNPNNSTYMIFRAFLDTFDDNYDATHNEFNYNGRGEVFYTYSTFKRTIGLSFKIAAQSRAEMYPLYRKLNYLVSNVAPEYNSITGRIQTPFIRLTVGDYLARVPGILNNMRLSWDKEYPWEVTADTDGMDSNMLQLPHILNVNVGFTPIHTFLPQKSVHSTFILPRDTEVNLKEAQKWYVSAAADSISSDETISSKYGQSERLKTITQYTEGAPTPTTNENGAVFAGPGGESPGNRGQELLEQVEKRKPSNKTNRTGGSGGGSDPFA